MRHFSLALPVAASIAVAVVGRSTLRRFQVDTTSFVMAMGRGAHGHWPLRQDAFLALGQPPARPLTGPVVLVAGVPGDRTRLFADLPLTGTVVIQVVRAEELGEPILPLVSKAATEGAKAWIVVTDLPEPVFARLARGRVVAETSGNP